MMAKIPFLIAATTQDGGSLVWAFIEKAEADRLWEDLKNGSYMTDAIPISAAIFKTNGRITRRYSN